MPKSSHTLAPDPRFECSPEINVVRRIICTIYPAVNNYSVNRLNLFQSETTIYMSHLFFVPPTAVEGQPFFFLWLFTSGKSDKGLILRDKGIKYCCNIQLFVDAFVYFNYTQIRKNVHFVMIFKKKTIYTIELRYTGRQLIV